MSSKRWDIKSNNKLKTVEEVVDTLLGNRGIGNKHQVEQFLRPQLSQLDTGKLLLGEELAKACSRVATAISKKEKIIIFGDYDVDGVCGCAILWETLKPLGAEVMPYLPHRQKEGYGLSFTQVSQLSKKGVTLIITVDNGVSAAEAITYAKSCGVDVIVTDHHQIPKQKPEPLAFIWTDQLCGAGVAYFLARFLKSQLINEDKNEHDDFHLELVALATVADLVPLVGANRILLKYGIEALRRTKRVGLQALLGKAQLIAQSLTVYDIGHIIAPRLNAMGRLEHAMDSLRLLCTKDQARGASLAGMLSQTNQHRQLLTISAYAEAKAMMEDKKKGKLAVLSHHNWQQGIIGLIASRVVEEFYLPTIVIAKGEGVSKGSARSVAGFNIIEALRQHQDLLVDVGGHPMAAGFTIETEKIILLEERLVNYAQRVLNDDHLTRFLSIDCQLPASLIGWQLLEKIQPLEPYGVGNPEPLFITEQLSIINMKLVGQSGKHLRLLLGDHNSGDSFEAIAFSMGDQGKRFATGDKVKVVYSLSDNTWNGNRRLQLKIRDIAPQTKNL